MNFKQILAAAGIAIGSAVGGFYAAPESEMDKLIDGITTVNDTLIPAHSTYDTIRDSTGAVVRVDSGYVEAKWNQISMRINNNNEFDENDTIIYLCIEKTADTTRVFGMRHAIGTPTRYIAKYDVVR